MTNESFVTDAPRQERKSASFTKRPEFNSVAKLAKSGNRFERRMPKAESCLLILA